MANVQVRLFGDTAKAATYVGWAKNQCNWLVGQCKALGLPFLERTYMVGEDIAVRIHASATEHTQNWVSIEAGESCSLFLDSGAIQLGIMGASAPERKNPGRIYVGTSLSDNTVWGDLILRDGVLAPKLTTYRPTIRPVIDGEIAYSLFSKKGSEGVYYKKAVMAACPASMFSGKLRLFVQALYGAAYSDAFASRWSAVGAGIPSLRYNGADFSYTISNEYGRSVGVFTDAAGRYWLMSTGRSSANTFTITVNKIQFSSCGAAALATVGKETPREQAAFYEATAFADALPSKDIQFTLDTKVPIPVGYDSMAYGWAFNWAGDEAHIVLHKWFQEGAVANWHKKARVYRLKVACNVEGDISLVAGSASDKERARWSATIELLESDIEWQTTPGQVLIWVPMWGMNQLEWYEFGGEQIPVPRGQGAPLHCFYDKTDTIQFLRYSGAREAVSYSYEDPCAFAGGNYFWFPGVSAKTETISGTVTSGEVTISGVVVTIEGYSRGVARGTMKLPSTADTWDNRPPQNSSPPNPAYMPECYRGMYEAAYNAYQDWLNQYGWTPLPNKNSYGLATAEYKSVSGNEFRTQTCAVVIPTLDCAAVYVADSGASFRNDLAVKTYTDRRPVEMRTWRQQYINNVVELLGPIQGPAETTTYSPSNLEISTDTSTSKNDPLELVVWAGGSIPLFQSRFRYNLFYPSRSSPVHSDPFFTRSSAVYADLDGNGVYTGGYEILSGTGTVPFIGAA